MLHTAETTQPADICLCGYAKQSIGKTNVSVEQRESLKSQQAGQQMVTLQQHFSSMEETVQSLLQNQDSLEGCKVDQVDLMKAYKDKILEEMWKQQDRPEDPTAPAVEMPASPEAGARSEENSKDNNILLERLRALEVANCALSIENDNQRKQYERCLDEVANQVVKALLTQKNLKEECLKLRTRLFDLEQQNRRMSAVFQQCVKKSSISVSQDVPRNGKAVITAGRWPSHLSLTCPRSSGSGSEAAPSSACGDYSNGSYTWAEGHGFSKQSATSRDKRISTGSMSSNHSAPTEQMDLWQREAHIFKGLKCQMKSSKEESSVASVPHCKDCMTSNEGIYPVGLMCGQKETIARTAAPTSTPFKVAEGVSTQDLGEEPQKLGRGKSKDQPTKEHLCLDKLDVTREDGKHFLKDVRNSELFPSPDSDNFLFLEVPTVKPGVSPTDCLTHLEEMNNDSPENHNSSGLTFNDRNNNQEQSTERKSRLDHNKRQQDIISIMKVEPETNDAGTSIQHTATKFLSCMNEARHRSFSMEIHHCRDQTSQAGSHTESPLRKPQSQLCDSARKAFILRSKSADGGRDQARHIHSPLQQKLMKGLRSKGQSSTNASAQNIPSKRTNLNKMHDITSSSKDEKEETVTVQQVSKSLEIVQQSSPLASPVKHSKILKSQGINSNSPNKSSLQITRLSSTDSVEESMYDNLPCSPRKQRRQEKWCDIYKEDLRSPSPPPPPGRTTSLLFKPNSGSLPKELKLPNQAQNSASGNAASSSANTQSKECAPVSLTKQSNMIKDHHEATSPIGAECKDISDKIYNSHSSILPLIPNEESPISESDQFSARANKCFQENGAPSLLASQNILQRSKQSISEPKLSEVLPTAYSNVYYCGIANNPQISTSRHVKRSPISAKSHEAIAGQDTTTILLFGNQIKDDTKSAQTFQTFKCDPQMIHECVAQDKPHRKIETRCNSLDSEPVRAVPSDSGVILDWGFDEEGWLFKRSVSVSTRPILKPVMGMNGAKARSQSFGARYMERPSFNRPGKLRTQIKTQSGTSLNSLGDVLPGSMSCSSSYHLPMNRSLLNNFLIEEGLEVPSHLGSSSERLQNLKLQREQARRLQIEQQFSSAFGEPVSEEPERQSTITTIEEKVMLGIEENLHKSQEQERTNEVKQKSGSTLANWFGFRKSKLPAPSSKKTDPPKIKEDKREQKISSILGGKNSKSEKKKDRRKSDGKDCSVGRRESHDAVRACISMPCPGMSLSEIQRHSNIIVDRKMQSVNRGADDENGSTVKSPTQDAIRGEMETKKLTYVKSKTRATQSQQKEETRLQLAN
ncbi:uncharacterized protein ACNS7B_024262 isoform 3-T3 [Menidia menidia]